MLHLLLEAKKYHTKSRKDCKVDCAEINSIQEIEQNFEVNGKVTISDEDIAAQAMAGFETTSTLMSFIAYELALNPKVQNKLREEVDFVYEECNGSITYEALMNMKYMDMVVSGNVM